MVTPPCRVGAFWAALGTADVHFVPSRLYSPHVPFPVTRNAILMSRLQGSLPGNSVAPEVEIRDDQKIFSSREWKRLYSDGTVAKWLQQVGDFFMAEGVIQKSTRRQTISIRRPILRRSSSITAASASTPPAPRSARSRLQRTAVAARCCGGALPPGL